MDEAEQKRRAKKFVHEWQDWLSRKEKGSGKERGNDQGFWGDLIHEVLGVPRELGVPPDKKKFPVHFLKEVPMVKKEKGKGSKKVEKEADVFLPVPGVIIEHKNKNVKLDKKYRKEHLTAFEQAYNYAQGIVDVAIHWIITCNFSEFWIYKLSSDGKGYNISKEGRDPTVKISLKDLPQNLHKLKFLTARAEEAEQLDPTLEEENVSVKAGEIIKDIYEDLLEAEEELLEEDEELTEETLLSINVFCVRLVFCLYAENSGLFGEGAFRNYLSNPKNGSMRQAIENLFKVLDCDPIVGRKQDDCKHLLDDYKQLKSFPYVNGGLFRNKIKIPSINDKAKETIKEASAKINWRGISPTIFGAIFESTLNQDTREEGGMFYTPPENIHKVIDPLFLNDLKEELKEIKASSLCEHDLADALDAFQEKLASLTFLDPACGSGNFLTETFRSLRDLENEAILLRVQQSCKIVRKLVKVSIDQFYGIEINDFAVAVAKTAMWIADSQKFSELREALDELESEKKKEGKSLAKIEEDPKKSKRLLPLFECANIAEGNALAEDMNWGCLEVDNGLFQHKEKEERGEELRPSVEYDYIIGNPPFIGARKQTKAQKKELTRIVCKYSKRAAGNIDYVAGWFIKAAEFMKGRRTRTAFVSTSSITQGEQAAILWMPLLEDPCRTSLGVHIDFAHRTFMWKSESVGKKKAHVYCVIIGFSCAQNEAQRVIFNDGEPMPVENINAYLVDAPNKDLVTSMGEPLRKVPKVPEMSIGNKPVDGGNYLFNEKEKIHFLEEEPRAEKFFKLWYGTTELLNNEPRWCMWIGDATQAEVDSMPEVKKRENAVKKYRKEETTCTTSPRQFHVKNMPKVRYLAVPKVSTTQRKYIPMAFLTPEVLCSDLLQLIPGATDFHFGILMSDVHMAWVKAICGRYGDGYRYSGEIVYNNFPWVDPKKENYEINAKKVEETARRIQAVRDAFQKNGWTLGELYSEEQDDSENPRKKSSRTMPEELREAHRANNVAVRELFGFQGYSEKKIVQELFIEYHRLIMAKFE